MKLNKLFLFVAISPVTGFAQDIHFSQFDFSSQNLNPAITSVYKDLQVTLQHKEQWRSVNAFRTSAASFEMKFNQIPWIKIENATAKFKQKLHKGLAFGLNVFSDNAGDAKMKQTQGNLSIAYHALLDQNNTLSGGIMGGFSQRSISPDGLRWNDQYSGGVFDPNINPGENFTNQSFGYADFSTGLLWSYGQAGKYMTANDHVHVNAGFSIAHLNKPKYSFLANADNLKWKYTAHANTLVGIKNTKISLGGSLLYMQQGKLSELTFGGLVKYKPKEESKYTGYVRGMSISAGCYYRNKDAVIPYLLLELDKYSIGISYDTNISGLTAVTSGRGGFEIALRFASPSPFLYQTSRTKFYK